MKKRNRRKILSPAFSSYSGRVHIPYISTKPDIFANKKIYINSVCAGHVVVDESDISENEKEVETHL